MNFYSAKNLSEPQRLALHYIRTGTVYISRNFKGERIPRRTVTTLAWDRRGARVEVRRASVIALLKKNLVHESTESVAYPNFLLIKDGPEPLNR